MVVTQSFKRHAQQLLVLGFLVGSLSACGAGGGNPGTTAKAGGTGRSATETSAGAGVLTFAPSLVSATLEAGRSSEIAINATVTRPDDFRNASVVHAYFIDNTGVILPTVRISETGSFSYRIAMQTEPMLAVGNYKGNFIVKVCRDSNCNEHYPGSPMELPYDFTVEPARG